MSVFILVLFILEVLKSRRYHFSLTLEVGFYLKCFYYWMELLA